MKIRDQMKPTNLIINKESNYKKWTNKDGSSSQIDELKERSNNQRKKPTYQHRDVQQKKKQQRGFVAA